MTGIKTKQKRIKTHVKEEQEDQAKWENGQKWQEAVDVPQRQTMAVFTLIF